MSLVKAYGQEFYKEDRQVIEHSGTFNSSSAFFYLSLKTGNILNILSDQQFIAPILMLTLRRNIFCNRDTESELKNDDSLSLEMDKEERKDTLSKPLIISTSSQTLFQKQSHEAKNTDSQENQNIASIKATGLVSK